MLFCFPQVCYCKAAYPPSWMDIFNITAAAGFHHPTFNTLIIHGSIPMQREYPFGAAKPIVWQAGYLPDSAPSQLLIKWRIGIPWILCYSLFARKRMAENGLLRRILFCMISGRFRAYFWNMHWVIGGSAIRLRLLAW